MKKPIIALAVLVAVVTPAAIAKQQSAKQIATHFVNTVDKNAMGGEDEVASVGITCPVPGSNINPFTGAILISHADYSLAGQSKQRGVLMIKKPVDQPDGPLIFTVQNTGDDFDGPLLGIDLQFDQPNGTFYISVLKNGSATVAAGLKGKKSSNPIKCKVIPFDDAR